MKLGSDMRGVGRSRVGSVVHQSRQEDETGREAITKGLADGRSLGGDALDLRIPRTFPVKP